MEKRKSKRISVGDDVSGKVIFAADLAIQDLSMSGIRFYTYDRIVPHGSIQLVIKKKTDQLNLKGTVVRSSIMSTKTGGGAVKPTYEVAVAFAALSDTERASLKRLVALVEEG